jgi:hypothetical protein
MDGMTQMPASLAIETHLMNPPEIPEMGKTGLRSRIKSSSLQPTWQGTDGV